MSHSRRRSVEQLPRLALHLWNESWGLGNDYNIVYCEVEPAKIAVHHHEAGGHSLPILRESVQGPWYSLHQKYRGVVFIKRLWGDPIDWWQIFGIVMANWVEVENWTIYSYALLAWRRAACCAAARC